MAEAKLNILIYAKDKTEGFLGKIQNLFGGIMQTAGGLLAAGVIENVGSQIVDFGQNAINGASDLNETANKINTVFGDAAGAVNSFAANADLALGQSTQTALDAAATFGIFGKSAGLAGTDLSGFSTNLVGLSADLASFYNSSPQEAIDAIGAALRGETEPMRRFGVLLDDATLKSKALEMGLIENTKNALTPQQKVLAAYNVILDQTKVAQGDFAKTSEGFANSQRIIAAQWENINTQLGTAFLPLMEQGAQMVSTVVLPILMGLLNDFITPGITKFAEIGSVVLDFFTRMTEGSATLRDGVQLLFGDEGLALFDTGMELIQPLIDAFTDLADEADDSFPAIIKAARQMWEYILSAISINAPVIVNNFVNMLRTVTDFWDKYGDQIIQIVTVMFQILVAVISTALSLISTVISVALTVITGIFETFHNITQGNWSAAWESIKGMVDSVLNTITGFFRGFANTVLQLFGTNLTELKTMWTNNYEMLKTIVSTALGNAVQAVRDRINAMVEAGRDLVNRFKEGFEERFGGVIETVGEIISRIPEKIREWVGTMRSAGEALINGLRDGIVAQFDKILAPIMAFINSLPEQIKKMFGLSTASSTLMDIGANLMVDLERGISSNAALPIGAMAQVANSTVNNFILNANYGYESPSDVASDFRALELLYS